MLRSPRLGLLDRVRPGGRGPRAEACAMHTRIPVSEIVDTSSSSTPAGSPSGHILWGPIERMSSSPTDSDKEQGEQDSTPEQVKAAERLNALTGVQRRSDSTSSETSNSGNSPHITGQLAPQQPDAVVEAGAPGSSNDMLEPASSPSTSTNRFVAAAPSSSEHLQSEDPVAHAAGLCTPCSFFRKPGGCQKGVLCTFCHLCSVNDYRNYRNKRRAAARASRGEGRTKAEASAGGDAGAGSPRNASGCGPPEAQQEEASDEDMSS